MSLSLIEIGWSPEDEKPCKRRMESSSLELELLEGLSPMLELSLNSSSLGPRDTSNKRSDPPKMSSMLELSINSSSLGPRDTSNKRSDPLKMLSMLELSLINSSSLGPRDTSIDRNLGLLGFRLRLFSVPGTTTLALMISSPPWMVDFLGNRPPPRWRLPSRPWLRLAPPLNLPLSVVVVWWILLLFFLFDHTGGKWQKCQAVGALIAASIEDALQRSYCEERIWIGLRQTPEGRRKNSERGARAAHVPVGYS